MTIYKAQYDYGNNTLMKPGDIIIIDDDRCYNITRGLNFSVWDPAEFKNNYLTQISSNLDESFFQLYKGRPNTEEENNSLRIKEILDNMLQTYIKKNHDYGNSFEQSLNEEGLAAARIRMGDKWNRFKTLSKGENALVNDESITDTLLDFALYCVMTVDWLNDSKKV